MPRLPKERSRKAGLPPGTLVHIGERRREAVTISVITYDESSFQGREVGTIEECFPLTDTRGVTWINIEGLHETEVIGKLGECYGFHPLMLEDILNTDQRPKIEDYKDYLYIVVKMLRRETSEIITEQISLVLGPNFVISFQEGIEGDVFTPLRERIRNGKGRIRSSGADYLAYSLIDAIVDHYFVILEKAGERLEELEEELVAKPSKETLHVIHRLKREMIFLRKAVWPLREVISAMMREGSPLITDATKLYLRDVYDHTIQVIDSIETSRDILSGMLDIYLSSLSNRMNEVVKFLTIIGTVFLPLTFLVGVYGMNFDVMPELRWRWGYPLLWLIMIGIVVVMFVSFKRKKWL